ncbi:hypothetical protein GQ600_23420 [Phytophthora cactorum]|nr:hypothetical protein GQ600_23420 [Phytophthora cactorum]
MDFAECIGNTVSGLISNPKHIALPSRGLRAGVSPPPLRSAAQRSKEERAHGLLLLLPPFFRLTFEFGEPESNDLCLDEERRVKQLRKEGPTRKDQYGMSSRQAARLTSPHLRAL